MRLQAFPQFQIGTFLAGLLAGGSRPLALRRQPDKATRKRSFSPAFELLERRIQPANWSSYTSPSSSWLAPAAVAQAYQFNQIAPFNGVAPDGTGQTIAVFGIWDNPALIPSEINGTPNSAYTSGNGSDLHQFDTKFGLNDFTVGNWFQKIYVTASNPVK